MRKPTKLTILIAVAIAFIAVGLTQAGGRVQAAPDGTDRGEALQRAFAAKQDAPISVHRLLLDRMDLTFRTARAFQAAPVAPAEGDDLIRGNGLSDGPDPTDSRAQSEFDENEESKSDGDRSGEYQDAVDESSTGDQATRDLTMG